MHLLRDCQLAAGMQYVLMVFIAPEDHSHAGDGTLESPMPVDL